MSDVPLTKDQLHVGKRVKCIYNMQEVNGKSATISELYVSTYGSFKVKWDDASIRNAELWEFPSSFAALDDEPIVIHAQKILPRECACGIFRNDCTYHKE